MQTFPCISYVQGFVGGRLDAHNRLQNTGQEFDGSDSGARPDEAVSWGKIRAGAESVKVDKSIPRLLTDNFICLQVFADATLVFPLLVAATFARVTVPAST